MEDQDRDHISSRSHFSGRSEQELDEMLDELRAGKIGINQPGQNSSEHDSEDTPEENDNASGTGNAAKSKKGKSRKEGFNLKDEVISWIQVLVAAAIIAFCVNHFIIANSEVPTSSMETTIMAGDRVIGSRLSYKFGDPQRGDIAIFIYPDDEAKGIKTYYVKRIIGMPGDTIEIRDNQVYIDGVAAKNPEKMQLNYFVETDGSMLSEEQFRLLDVSKADRVLIDGSYNPQYMSMLNIQPNANGQYNPIYHFPLTQKTLEVAKKLPVVKRVVLEPDPVGTDSYYPVDYQTGWSRDNYGPLWIPKKGTTIPLTERNIALYKRCIVNYEHNKLEVKDSKVYINGKPETTYTFKYDYYWMMGDNRHNSADSRSWGFVPEDHIVGKPIMIWLSLDKDRSLFDGGIRWNRMFRWVHPD